MILTNIIVVIITVITIWIKTKNSGRKRKQGK